MKFAPSNSRRPTSGSPAGSRGRQRRLGDNRIRHSVRRQVHDRRSMFGRIAGTIRSFVAPIVRRAGSCRSCRLQRCRAVSQLARRRPRTAAGPGRDGRPGLDPRWSEAIESEVLPSVSAKPPRPVRLPAGRRAGPAMVAPASRPSCNDHHLPPVAAPRWATVAARGRGPKRRRRRSCAPADQPVATGCHRGARTSCLGVEPVRPRRSRMPRPWSALRQQRRSAGPWPRGRT